MHIFKAFLAAAMLCAAAASSPFVIVEDFSSNPSARGWEKFGGDDLIRWNPQAGNVEVTWDSTRANQYLRLPLQTVLARNDHFSVALDLCLLDFDAGVNPSKRGAFQIAFGFQNAADAARTNFFRAAQGAAPNLVEFNFLPDSGFGPTIWPAVFSTNGAMNYSGASDFGVFDLPTSAWMRVSLAYNGSNETATITITSDNTVIGQPVTARLATNDVAFGKKFTQFKVDAFAIASYSDHGYAGSILAHGLIDNIVLSLPPRLKLLLESGPALSFDSQTNWVYTLETSANLQSWTALATEAGTGSRIAITNLSPSLYRVRAERID